jgi:selenoprotein W-related protein
MNTDASPGHRPRLEIRFCPKCRWYTRATWLAQELFITYPDALLELALVPAGVGTFEVVADGEVIFSRAATGRFPEPKELKQALRDRFFPERDLGHSGGPGTATPLPSNPE